MPRSQSLLETRHMKREREAERAAHILYPKDAKRPNPTLHAVLNNWVYRADSSRRCSGEAMRRELVKHDILPPSQCTNKTWLMPPLLSEQKSSERGREQSITFAAEWRRLAVHHHPARILTQAADAQGPLTPLAWTPAWPSGASRVGASHSSLPPARPPASSPACKTRPSTEAFGPASRLPLLPPHLPSANSELSPAQDRTSGTLTSQHAVVVQNQLICTMGS
ncbi:Hypothetical predicted protein [Scomber scombrus]|uniref:Uncharacterized protein n=1 Tax=Scomber scombrus TaxID=13677 RepID=A0AAV1MZ36_SCOSC